MKNMDDIYIGTLCENPLKILLGSDIYLKMKICPKIEQRDIFCKNQHFHAVVCAPTKSTVQQYSR